jgi:hypothetical protein
MIVSTSASGQTISVNAWGSPDYNVYPHMEVWGNGVLLGVWDVTGTAQTYTVYNKYTVRFNNDYADGPLLPGQTRCPCPGKKGAFVNANLDAATQIASQLNRAGRKCSRIGRIGKPM